MAGGRRGKPKFDFVQGAQLLLVGAGFKFGFKEQLFLPQRHDLPLGQPYLAFDGIDPEGQRQRKSAADGKDKGPANRPDAVTGEVHAAFLLGDRGGDFARQAAAALESSLSDPDAAVRRQAAQSLGWLGEAAAGACSRKS